MSQAWIPPFLDVALWVCLLYSGALMAVVLSMLVLATSENRARLRQRDLEDYETLHRSRFTIPVSILAPALNEEAVIVPAVRSLLAQDYPEFEVILVDDGSSDGTLELLRREFDLVRREFFFRRVLPSAPVRGVYQSRREPRLTVVSKANGGTKADPLNCGVNFARYRYVCCVDGDTVFAPDALMNAMSLVVKDPGTIVGAASLFGISREPELESADPDQAHPLDRHLLSAFQHLEIMRSFMAYRLAWSRLDCMLCNPGAFAIWRRDVVLEAGGFSPNFTCEDIEFTFRVHQRFLREGRPYKVISLPFMVARTEGPETLGALVRQRARWQRVVLETVWAFRGMLGRPAFRTVGLVGLPYYVLFEALAPFFQLFSMAAFLLAAWFRLIDWPAYFALLGAVVFATSIPTTMTVHLHDATYRNHRPRDLAWLMLLGPLDLFLYRPVLVYAGLKGTKDWIQGKKGWEKFARNKRRDPAHPN